MAKTYLITGGNGYIGLMIIKKLLSRADEPRIIAVVRDAKRIRKELLLLPRVQVIEGDIVSPEFCCAINFKVDYIIHTAAPTESKYMVNNPVETADAIVLGTKNVLEMARKLDVKSVVVLSSMEVYGQATDIGRLRLENELGQIDITSPRSCYPLGKSMAEHYCHIYYREYGVPVKVARLAQTFGKGVKEEDNRAYMQFARAAVNGEDIILRTKGLSMGNYCAIEDVLNAVFLLLEKGQDGEIYNVVNEKNTMTIRDMADMVATDIAKGKIGVRVEEMDSSKTGYPPDTGLRISGEKLQALGWQANVSLRQMYEDVINEILKWQ